MDKKYQDIEYTDLHNHITYWQVRMVRLEQIIFGKEIIQISYIDNYHVHYVVELPKLELYTLSID